MSGEIRTVRGGGVFLKGNGYSIFSVLNDLEDVRGIGPNSQVLLSITTPGLPFTFSGRDCIKGLPDPIGYAFADAYLMEFNGEKWIRDGALGKEVYVPQSTKLIDISNSPAVIGGILGDTSQDYFLGFTAPEGKIALGKDYSILIDECQNTVYDQINPGGFGSQDSILVDAFTADSKVEEFASVCDSIVPLPSHCESSIKDLKHDAGIKLNLALDEYSISQAEFNGLKELVKSGFVDYACSVLPRAQEFTCRVISKSGIEFFAPSIVSQERKKALESFYLLKKYDKIFNDPPNFNYKNLTTLEGNPLFEFKDSSLSTDPYYQSIENVINNFTMEATLIPPMVSSMEGYLGADQSGDILWMPIHALEVANFSSLLSQQISTTNIALSTLKLAIEQDNLTSPANINLLNQENQKIASTGFNNTEIRELQNLGLGDKVDVIRSSISSKHFPTDSKQKALTSIINLIKLNSQQKDHLIKLSDQMNLNANTAMQKFRALVQYDLPVSDAGGPYSGLEGNNIILDGTKSKATEGTKLVTYQWDLDSDGQFDDADGATVSYVFKKFAGFIGLKVTNEFGRSSIDYSRINIADSLEPPKISNFSPDKRMIILDINQTVSLNISTVSTSGALSKEWTIDGKLTSDKDTSIIYTPSNNDIGSHSIVVKVSDKDGRYVTNQWIVVVIKPDNDNDTWHANVDCDDTNLNINPGMKEIHYNGIDDDCNPATLDDNTPPIANNQTVSAFQNQTSTFSLTGSDIDDDPLTFSIVKQAINGTLGNVTGDIGQTAFVDYKPKPNFHGTDKFVIVANDGNDTSNNATIQVNVAIADTPIAHDQTLVINENTPTEINLTATSPDRHPLHFSIRGQKAAGVTGQPAVGTIKNFQSTGPYSAKATYIPGPNFVSDRYGYNDTFSFTVNDGPPVPGFEGREASNGLVTIKVNEVNNPPEPFNKVIRTIKNKPVNITLRAADADNDFYSQGSKTNNGLNFSIVEQPSHGTLGQIITNSTTIRFPPQSDATENYVTYTPNTGFVGQDIFTFKATDGIQDSVPGNVTVIVGQANQTFSQIQDGDVIVGTQGQIALCDTCGKGPQWFKPDGTYVKTMPSSLPTVSPALTGGAFDSSGNLYVTEFGSLVLGYPNGVSIYNKTGGYTGGWANRDDFGCTSMPVSGLNCMLPESMAVDKRDNIYVGGIATESGPLEIDDNRDDIRKFDRNGNLLEIFNVVAENRGSDWIELGPDQCTMYYTSEDIHIKRYNVCTDSQMSDFANVYGVGRSLQDLGSSAQSLPNFALRLLPDGGFIVASWNEIWRLDSAGNLIQRYDAPGENKWFAINLNPDGKSFWSASLDEPDIYQFDLSSGKILQQFKIRDNAGITGIYVKGEPIVSTTEFPPTAFSQNLTTNKNIPLSINLTGFDIANDEIGFSIGSGPSSGTLGPITKLSSNISRVIYTPNIDFQGSDSFTFKANDGKLDSNNTASIDITINHEPIAFNDVANTSEDQSITIPLLANDTDQDQDVISIVSVNGSSVLGHIVINPNETITYTPFTNFTGSERFNYTITDGKGGNDTAQVILNISPRNAAPISNSQDVTTVKNVAINLTLTGSDMNNDTLTFSRFFGPYNGFVSKFNSTSGILQYTPLKNFHGQDRFTFRVSDGKDWSLPSIVNITIRDDGSNDPPNAFSERTSTERNKPVTIDVLSNDDDPNGDPLTIANITGPVNGTAVVNQNETITFTPLRNFNGSDAFIYNVTDGKGGSDIAQVIVDVRRPSSNAPTVQDQSLSTNKNTPLNITLTGTSPSGSALTFSILDKSTHGNLSGITPINNTAAKIVYSPTLNFTGSDLFTFKANNGTVDSNIGTVTIAVNGSSATNTPPIARDDSAKTNEDKPVVIPVLTNDTDIDGDILAVDSIKIQPTNGTSIINSNGTVTYSPNTNFFGADGFNYTISDGKGGNASAHVTVTVNLVNDPPVATNDVATTLQDKSVVVNVLANDTDPEGDPLVISAITNPPSNGTAIINNNGTITYSPQAAFSGIDSFIYQASDGNGGNSTATVVVNVNAVNKPPVVTILKPTNGSKFTFGNSIAFSGQAFDPEDGNISSIMNWQSNIDGALGIGPKIVAASLSQGVHTITASAIDSDQLSNSSSIEIFVNVAGNQPPVAVGDHFKTNEDNPVNMNVIANDTDPENDDLTIAAINQTANNGQAIVNNNNNTINYSPNRDFNGQDSLTYTVTDGRGGKSSAQVLIDVLAVNDNPIARNDSTATNKNTAVLIDVLANDTDADNDPLTISQVTTPAHGSASIENAKIKYTPNLSFVGIDKFDYSVSDGNRGNAKASVTVNVKSVNQLPVAVGGSASTNENTALKMKLNASDPDNDPLTYIIDIQPTQGSISAFNANNGTLTYTPQSNFTGQDSLKFKVNDGTSDSNVATVIISVKNVNHPPITEDQNVVTPINKQIEITLKGHDPDASDKITFVKVTDPVHGIIAGFDSSTGKLTYIPNNGFSGTDSFLFKVIDNNKAESNIGTVSITVNAVVNKPPVAVDVNVETSQDTAKVMTLVGTDPDAGDKITYHIVSAASSGSISSIDQTTGKVTYTPNKGFLGLDLFTYKVTDLSGANSNIATVGITVKSTSQTPYPLPPSCSPNDKSGGKALRGTNSDDVIVGTEAADSIQGLSGNDAINGCGASDNLNGNAGNDGIAGGTNEDNIHGNNGNDYLRGDAGNDGLYGGEGDDILVGGPGRDSFYCGSGNDKVLDFNAKEGDALQKQSNTKGRDATQKSDCENVSSISSTSSSAKSSSQVLPPTPTEQISPRDDGNQSQPITTQLQPAESSTQKGQNETNQSPQNSQPTVTNYAVSIDKNQRVSIILSGNDNDGDKLLFKIINKPQNALIGNFNPSSGSLTYNPNKDYVGDDKFTFTANDGNEESNIGTVTIHVKDKQTIVEQQTESQPSKNQVKPFPLIYWRGNLDKTEKLLPLNVGNLTVDSADQVTKVLKISSDNHNIYDNTAAQILTAKFNIKNDVNSCKKVNEVIKYGDEILHSVNYQGVGTAIQELSDPQMKSMIKAYSILTQFNIQGCIAISPTDTILAPGIFEILYSDPF